MYTIVQSFIIFFFIKSCIISAWAKNPYVYTQRPLFNPGVSFQYQIHLNTFPYFDVIALHYENYDTENHIEKPNHTENPPKPHWKALQKIITLKLYLYNHTEIYLLLVSKNVNPL